MCVPISIQQSAWTTTKILIRLQTHEQHGCQPNDDDEHDVHEPFHDDAFHATEHWPSYVIEHAPIVSQK